MSGLKNLYKQMKDKDLTYTIFDYRHNSIALVAMFDIDKNPFQLLIIKKGTNLTLSLDIEYGFSLETFLLPEDYEKLKEILEIPRMPKGENPFQPSEFFKEFNKKIPSTLLEYTQSSEIKQIFAKFYNPDEDENKIYILGMIDWTGKNKTYSEKNREKTRILYPEVYRAIKDKNISIKYTSNENCSKNTTYQTCKFIHDEEE